MTTRQDVRDSVADLINQWRRDAIHDFRMSSEPDRSPIDRNVRRDALTKANHADQLERLLPLLDGLPAPGPGEAVIPADTWAEICAAMGYKGSIPGTDSYVSRVVRELKWIFKEPRVSHFLDINDADSVLDEVTERVAMMRESDPVKAATIATMNVLASRYIDSTKERNQPPGDTP